MAKAPIDVRSRARAHTEMAIRVLVEIMLDPSAPHSARVNAATQILNRGIGTIASDHVRFIPDNREFYVYSVHDPAGSLLYIGKGRGRRSVSSARRLSGRARVRAVFSSEKSALAFERRLIQKFKPPHNILYGGRTQ